MFGQSQKKKSKHSDGFEHAKITLAFIPIAALLGVAAFFVPFDWWLRGLIAGFGCLLGIIFSPDLDLPIMTTAEQVWFKIPIIGYRLGHLWSCFWYPYASVMPHRGLSHNPIFGTLTRVLYFIIGIPVELMFFKIGILLYLGESVTMAALMAVPVWWFGLLTGNLGIVLLIVIGLYVSDIGHVGRDLKGWQI